ncbi:MAG: two-component regulator propeller domain-containing protein, partial [Planctomycetota bacterium]
MKLALVSLLALSACSPDRTSNGDGGAAAAPAVGRTVTEIDPRIWCIHEDQQGTLWLGSNGSGVYRYDGQQIVNVTSANGLSGDQVRNIQDANGTVFISTTGGVTAFDGTAFTRLEPEAPTDGDGWRLDPDDVWLVANPGIGGPCRYDGERLHQLELSESPAEAAHRAKYPGTDFPPDAVYCTYTDHRGHVWFGTAAVGLCRYDGATLSWMFEDHLTT